MFLTYKLFSKPFLLLFVLCLEGTPALVPSENASLSLGKGGFDALARDMGGSHFIPGLEIAPDDFLDCESELVGEHWGEGSADRTGHDLVQCAREYVLMARPRGWGLDLLRATGQADWTAPGKWPRDDSDWLGTGLDLYTVGGGNLLGEGCRRKGKDDEGKEE